MAQAPRKPRAPRTNATTTTLPTTTTTTQDELATLDDVAQIALPDGTILDARQSLACVLKATSDLTIDEIAQRAGYPQPSAASRFLRSDKGLAGVRQALTLHLTHDGLLALRVLRTLAQSSKSDLVRLNAASKLADLAGIAMPEQAQARTSASPPSITINIGGETHASPVIDVSPQQQD